jgi:predicted amidohydrolase YtcJ
MSIRGSVILMIWNQDFTRDSTKRGRVMVSGFMLSIFFALPAISLSQKNPADLVVVNANVRTMKSRADVVEAFAGSNGRITSVGKNEAIRKLIGPSTRVIDAHGRLVLPGFNDAHVHFLGIGNSFSSLDLRNVNDAQAMTERIALYVAVLPKGRWLLGGGWSDANVKLPDRSSVDALTPDNPVFLYSADGRSAFANGRAFQLAGLKGARPDVDRKSNGDPTGIVRGGALQRLAAVVPTNHIRNWTEIAETATNYAASLGVTSVQDMHSDDTRAIYRELDRQGKLKTRVYDCLPLSDWKKLSDLNLTRDNTAMVRGGCLKGFSDGDASAASKLESDIAGADKAGFQVMIHAIGNGANAIVLDAFESATKANGKRDRRFRAEHAHNPRLTDLPRFARSKIIVSMQPRLFEGRTGGYYANLLRLKTPIAFGSDAAITDLEPILGIHAAVTAGTEAIPTYEAVRAYTIGSAYAEFQENEKGTIEVGKLADFVILSDDIFSVEPSRLRQAKVLTTVVGGRVVYQRQ